MAFKYREEIVGKRFLSVRCQGKLKLSKICEWDWRPGIIRASSHKDPTCRDVSVLVEFDDTEWQRREWIRVADIFQLFLVENTLVSGLRHDPFKPSVHKVWWPALTFKAVVDRVGYSGSKQKVVEYLGLSEQRLGFIDEFADIKPYKDAVGLDGEKRADQDYPEVRKAVRRWVELQDGQGILLTTPSVLVGYRVQVYRSEGTTQWYTAVIQSYNENTRELSVTDDTVLEEHNEDPSLVQMRLIGDGVVDSILKGVDVGITPRRRACNNKDGNARPQSTSGVINTRNRSQSPSHASVARATTSRKGKGRNSDAGSESEKEKVLEKSSSRRSAKRKCREQTTASNSLSSTVATATKRLTVSLCKKAKGEEKLSADSVSERLPVEETVEESSLLNSELSQESRAEKSLLLDSDKECKQRAVKRHNKTQDDCQKKCLPPVSGVELSDSGSSSPAVSAELSDSRSNSPAVSRASSSKAAGKKYTKEPQYELRPVVKPLRTADIESGVLISNPNSGGNPSDKKPRRSKLLRHQHRHQKQKSTLTKDSSSENNTNSDAFVETERDSDNQNERLLAGSPVTSLSSWDNDDKSKESESRLGKLVAVSEESQPSPTHSSSNDRSSPLSTPSCVSQVNKSDNPIMHFKKGRLLGDGISRDKESSASSDRRCKDDLSASINVNHSVTDQIAKLSSVKGEKLWSDEGGAGTSLDLTKSRNRHVHSNNNNDNTDAANQKEAFNTATEQADTKSLDGASVVDDRRWSSPVSVDCSSSQSSEKFHSIRSSTGATDDIKKSSKDSPSTQSESPASSPLVLADKGEHVRPYRDPELLKRDPEVVRRIHPPFAAPSGIQQRHHTHTPQSNSYPNVHTPLLTAPHGGMAGPSGLPQHLMTAGYYQALPGLSMNPHLVHGSPAAAAAALEQSSLGLRQIARQQQQLHLLSSSGYREALQAQYLQQQSLRTSYPTLHSNVTLSQLEILWQQKYPTIPVPPAWMLVQYQEELLRDVTMLRERELVLERERREREMALEREQRERVEREKEREQVERERAERERKEREEVEQKHRENEARERQERERKEEERQEREKQERLERERVLKESAAAAAVNQHFAESLRLASQKGTWAPPMSLLMHKAGSSGSSSGSEGHRYSADKPRDLHHLNRHDQQKNMDAKEGSDVKVRETAYGSSLLQLEALHSEEKHKLRQQQEQVMKQLQIQQQELQNKAMLQEQRSKAVKDHAHQQTLQNKALQEHLHHSKLRETLTKGLSPASNSNNAATRPSPKGESKHSPSEAGYAGLPAGYRAHYPANTSGSPAQSTASSHMVKSEPNFSLSAATSHALKSDPNFSLSAASSHAVKSEPNFSLYGYQPFQHTFISQDRLQQLHRLNVEKARREEKPADYSTRRQMAAPSPSASSPSSSVKSLASPPPLIKDQSGKVHTTSPSVIVENTKCKDLHPAGISTGVPPRRSAQTVSSFPLISQTAHPGEMRHHYQVMGRSRTQSPLRVCSPQQLASAVVQPIDLHKSPVTATESAAKSRDRNTPTSRGTPSSSSAASGTHAEYVASIAQSPVSLPMSSSAAYSFSLIQQGLVPNPIYSQNGAFSSMKLSDGCPSSLSPVSEPVQSMAQMAGRLPAPISPSGSAGSGTAQKRRMPKEHAVRKKAKTGDAGNSSPAPSIPVTTPQFLTNQSPPTISTATTTVTVSSAASPNSSPSCVSSSHGTAGSQLRVTPNMGFMDSFRTFVENAVQNAFYQDEHTHNKHPKGRHKQQDSRMPEQYEKYSQIQHHQQQQHQQQQHSQLQMQQSKPHPSHRYSPQQQTEHSQTQASHQPPPSQPLQPDKHKHSLHLHGQHQQQRQSPHPYQQQQQSPHSYQQQRQSPHSYQQQRQSAHSYQQQSSPHSYQQRQQSPHSYQQRQQSPFPYQQRQSPHSFQHQPSPHSYQQQSSPHSYQQQPSPHSYQQQSSPHPYQQEQQQDPPQSHQHSQLQPPHSAAPSSTLSSSILASATSTSVTPASSTSSVSRPGSAAPLPSLPVTSATTTCASSSAFVSVSTASPGVCTSSCSSLSSSSSTGPQVVGSITHPAQSTTPLSTISSTTSIAEVISRVINGQLDTDSDTMSVPSPAHHSKHDEHATPPKLSSSHPKGLKKAWLQRHSDQDREKEQEKSDAESIAAAESKTEAVKPRDCYVNCSYISPTKEGGSKSPISMLANVSTSHIKELSSKVKDEDSSSSASEPETQGTEQNQKPPTKPKRRRSNSSSSSSKKPKLEPESAPPGGKKKLPRKAKENKSKQSGDSTAETSGKEKDKESKSVESPDKTEESLKDCKTEEEKSTQLLLEEQKDPAKNDPKQPSNAESSVTMDKEKDTSAKRRSRKAKDADNSSSTEKTSLSKNNERPNNAAKTAIVKPIIKPTIAQLKKSQNPFLQEGPCSEVTPKLMKCRECKMTPNQRNKKLPNIFCRFYAFRRLRYSQKGSITIAGFSDMSDADQDDIDLWMPNTPVLEPRWDVDTAKYIVTHVTDKFCELVEQEKEAGVCEEEDAKIVWKKAVQGVREMCDVCDTTLFNTHWVCHKCGFVVCVDCYKVRANKSNTKAPGNLGSSWLPCSANRQQHEPDKLMLTQIIPSDALWQLGKLIHEIRDKWKIKCDCPCIRRGGNNVTPKNGVSQLLDTVSQCISSQCKADMPLVNGTGESHSPNRGGVKKMLGSYRERASCINGLRDGNKDSHCSTNTMSPEMASLSLLADVTLASMDCETSLDKSQDIKNKVKDRLGYEYSGKTVTPVSDQLKAKRGRCEIEELDADKRDANDCSTLRDLLTKHVSKLALATRSTKPNTENNKKSGKSKTIHSTLDDLIQQVVERNLPRELPPPKSNLSTAPPQLPTPAPIKLLHYVPRNGTATRSCRPHSSGVHTLTESSLLYPDVPHSWLCDGRLLRLLEPQHKGNLKLFQQQWCGGQPVLVSGCDRYIGKDLWRPQLIDQEFGEHENDLVNCRTGEVSSGHALKSFWDGFENISKRLTDDKDEPMILKLKDWPPSEDFADMMPARYHDLMQALPLPEYTHHSGLLNLASRLPEFFVKPDLGPRLCSAYGSALCPQDGSTNLHVDICDVVNLMMYVGVAQDDKYDHQAVALKAIDDVGCDVMTKRRVREAGDVPGALWHIYDPQDADKIRDLLNKVAKERGEKIEPHHDPIHEQSWYLNEELRDHLQKEYGVTGYTIIQCLGDAVFIPAGAPHQVQNLHSCIQIAEDFVSPENLNCSFQLTQEFRDLSDTHSNHEDKLQVKNIVYHAVKDAVAILNEIDPED